MNKIYFIFFLLFIHVTAIGQKNITLGKPYAVIDAEAKFYFAKGEEILTVKIDRATVMLQKFNSGNLNFVKIRNYDDFPKGYQVENVSKFKDRYYFFYSYWDGEHEQLFCREIDFESGAFKTPGQRIISVDQKIAGSVVSTGFYRVGVVDKFDFYFSYDSSTMVAQYRMKPEVRNDAKSYDVIGMHVYDADMRELWAQRVKMPYTEKKMNNIDYSVDSKGNVYIVTSVYNDDTTDEKKRREENANYHLELLRVTGQDGQISITKADVKDKFVQTLWLYEAPQGFMICAGFYNNGKSYGNADGIMMFKLAQDGKMFDLFTYEIPNSILNQFVSGRQAKKNDKNDDEAEFSNLKLREIYIQRDGSILLIGEQAFIRTHYTYSSTGGRTYYTYHYNDMLVSKIDAQGKMAWMRKLPKRQTGQAGIGGMSYKYVRGNEEHFFLFLDNEKNKELPVTKVPAQHVDGAGGFLTAYRVQDGSGETTKMLILNTREVGGIEIFQFTPRRIMAVSKSTIVFEAYKKKKEDILIKVDLSR